jgi:type IV fimbrial biogenesis protein FimT
MKRPSRGFTLLEIMVAIALVGILLAFGVPSFRQFTQNNAVVAAHNDLVTSLQLARSEALRRNRPVSVCASVDGEDCSEDTDWRPGWITFIDRGVAGRVDGTDEILQRFEPSNRNLTFDADTATFVQFQPTGMASADTTIELYWEGCSGDRLRRIQIQLTGAVSTEIAECPTS